MFERIHKDRGRVLLAIRIHSVWWTLFLWAVVAAWLGAVVLTSPRLSRLGGALASGSACIIVLLRYLLYPRIKFYENGVEIPPSEDHNGPRYLRWDQIERSSWDDDRLVLSGISSVLAGGPVQGGAVRIPPTQRLAVDQILGKRAPAD
jgi:hypothetical protein